MNRWILIPLVCALALGARPANAQETSHELSLYLRSGATANLTALRTMGGVGLGLGVRDVVNGLVVLQADASYLTMLGHVGELRVGAGVQHAWGAWTPKAMLTGSLLVGQRLSFRTPGQGTVSNAPSGLFGVSLSPLRFCAQTHCVSVLELGAGYGTDGAAGGPAFNLGVLEVEVRF